MLVYVYNTETKEYLYTQKAQINPKKTDEYLMPANSTTIQIPKIIENKVILWNGEYWITKDDFRGKYMVNSEMTPVIIVNYGDLPEGYALITEEQIKKIEEKGQNYYIITNKKLILNPNYEKEQNEKEKKRIDNLNMTKYDFYKYICKPNGINYKELMQYVNGNDEIAAAWNLCERVYRGNEILITAVMAVIPSMTDKKLTEIFETVSKND